MRRARSQGLAGWREISTAIAHTAGFRDGAEPPATRADERALFGDAPRELGGAPDEGAAATRSPDAPCAAPRALAALAAALPPAGSDDAESARIMIEVLYGGAATRLALDAEYEDNEGAEQRRRIHAVMWLFLNEFEQREWDDTEPAR